MAKKKDAETTTAVDKPKSKAQSIRDALAAQPKAMPKEIADKLTAEGISVTANEVSQAKYQIKLAKKKRRQKAAPKAADAASSAAAAPAGDLVSVAALQKAKKLVQELGGVKEARQALVALAQLLD
jgi:arginine repressor